MKQSTDKSRETLRILTIANVPPDPNSGAAGTVWHTNEALRELGHEVDAIWAGDLGPRRIKHGNLHSLLEQPRAYSEAALKAVSQKDYDAIMISQPQGWLATKRLKQAGFCGVVINRSHGVELRVNTIVPEWHRRLKIPESRNRFLTTLLRPLLDRQWRAVAKAADGIVTGCELDRHFLVETFALSPDRVQAIPHGVNSNFRQPLEPSSNSRWKRLLYVGQLAFIKGPDLLIQIVNDVLAREPQASFTWVGAKKHESETLARFAVPVRPRITVFGWLKSTELAPIYDHHGLFIFPTLFEGFGKAPFEAMARGMCVISAAEGGMHDHLQNGKNGHLFPRGDISSAISLCIEMLNDPQKAAACGQAGTETAATMTWRNTAQRVESFIKERMYSCHTIPHRKSTRRIFFLKK